MDAVVNSPDTAARHAIRFESEGLYQDALRGYDKLLFGPNPSPGVWSLKAELLMKLSRFAEALECYDIALSRGRYGDEGVCVGRGICLLAVGRLKEALGVLDRAVQMRARPVTMAIIAEVLHRLGRNSEAEQLRTWAGQEDRTGEALARADEIIARVG